MLVRHRVAALLTVPAALVAAGTVTATAATGDVTGGHTTISLSSAAATSFDTADVTVSAIKPATRKGATLTLPNTGGTADQGNFRLESGGGILFVHGSKRVAITKLVLNTRTSRIAGTITGHSSTVVATIGEPMGGAGGKGFTTLGPYSITWSADAAKALNHDLATTAFTANKRVLGSGKLDARYRA